MRKNKVGVNLHYLPISSLLNQSKESFKKKLPNSYLYARSSFSIPLYYDLSFKDQIKIAKKINMIFKKKFIMKKKLVVHFFGLSGSGKTTFSKKLYNILKKKIRKKFIF